ncbi:ligase-associated DNA damage response endonuclease PdeM [Marinivivus vitaminiproducens]|uniref:ligase-associated DNA damage response endonuclease PdeM n=1 Tax=Marinivivus vitaminiproducens TaxID=3035935 RepID=UPI0027AB0B97|nr:ligase-associated DNA damage response endonuclease PdeM [Geminicoccaceae bacterium SCSIO 64248]
MSLSAALHLPGAALVADPSGALYWPERDLLVVSDLHLEKATSFAGRGRLLPPYDTRATLERLTLVLHRYRPATVLSLGDSFHDTGGHDRLQAEDRDVIRAMTARHRWLWLAGNHDPDGPGDLGGAAAEAFELGGLVFRHHPGGPGNEVAGHLHPKACVRTRAKTVSRPCFVTDGRRLILPAFGAYTGGLNALDPAVCGHLAPDFWAYLLGRGKIHVLPGDRLDPSGVQLSLLAGLDGPGR